MRITYPEISTVPLEVLFTLMFVTMILREIKTLVKALESGKNIYKIQIPSHLIFLAYSKMESAFASIVSLSCPKVS